MTIFESYHGTNNVNAEILCTNVKINIPIVSSESMKQKGKRKPGSFGYGLYTFLNDYELAKNFALKFFEAADCKILNIESDINEDQLLSMLNPSDRSNFHAFREQADKSAKAILSNFGKNIDTKEQHVLDGIFIELFIKNLFAKENIKVVAVLGDSFTSISNCQYSYVPNGTELCIRDKTLINKCEIYCD